MDFDGSYKQVYGLTGSGDDDDGRESTWTRRTRGVGNCRRVFAPVNRGRLIGRLLSPTIIVDPRVASPERACCLVVAGTALRVFEYSSASIALVFPTI